MAWSPVPLDTTENLKRRKVNLSGKIRNRDDRISALKDELSRFKIEREMIVRELDGRKESK